MARNLIEDEEKRERRGEASGRRVSDNRESDSKRMEDNDNKNIRWYKPDCKCLYCRDYRASMD